MEGVGLRATVMVLLTLLLVASALLTVPSLASPVPIADEGIKYYWARTYGGVAWDEANNAVLMPDGDLLVIGCWCAWDVLAFRIDGETGDVKWAYSYMFGESQQIYGASLCPDGSIVMVGWYEDEIGTHTLAMKISGMGGVMWKKTYGLNTFFYDVVVAPDGHIYVIGTISIFGEGDVWLLELDSMGNIVSQRAYGGPEEDTGRAITLTPDGDLVIAGSFADDLWVFKVDPSDGSVLWSYLYGGALPDGGLDVLSTPDGDLIVLAFTYSFGAEEIDLWVLRLDGATGDVEWQRRYGGPGFDLPEGLDIGPDGSIYVIGFTDSFAGLSNGAFWLLKLNGSNGDVVWERAYDGDKQDLGRDVLTTADGDVVAVGTTSSFGVYVDAWVLKLDGEGRIRGCALCHDTSAIVAPTTAVKQALTIGGATTDAVPYEIAVSLTDIKDEMQVFQQCWAEVDVAPPEVSITNPVGGAAVRGTITIQADASDNVGVTQVEFYVDDELLYADTEPPFECEFDTTAKADGHHTLKAIAYDAEGNSAEDQITITIDNTAPVISSVSHQPSAPVEGEVVVVTAHISDATTDVHHATLYYRVNGGAWKSLDMEAIDGGWSAAIPAQEAGAKVEYYVEAVDEAGNTATSSIYSYTVASKPAPSFFGLELWHILLIAIIVLLVVLIIVVLVRR